MSWFDDPQFVKVVELVVEDARVMKVREELFKGIFTGRECFVVSLVLSDLNEHSRELIRKLMEYFGKVSSGERQLLEGIGKATPLSEMTADNLIRDSPLLLHTYLFPFSHNGVQTFIAFYLMFTDVWDQAAKYSYSELTQFYWKSNLLSYEQQGVINSLMCIHSSMQLVHVPLVRNGEKLNRDALFLALNQLTCYVKEMCSPAFESCLVGLLIDHEGLEKPQGGE